ncbi:hypothetical protein MHA02_12010 [Methylobacterium haplocladii]|uniref:Peptidoglycan binding-like domain-containing protein n=1 Tax=Methylobacterium haplocladii TaxID=1176176 RepID=A0A512IM66_9HYPH|nr:hypothetical protein MHA02_12010 [Methylobacterium haplocladii]
MLLVPAAHAQGPAPALPTAKPRPPAPAQPAADPAYEAARAAFEALPEAQRRAIQDSLVWTGDYNAVTAGTFGRRTYEGIVGWQRRQGVEPTGILTVRDRPALDAAGEAVRKSLRFTVQADPASGAVIGVPEKLLARKSPLPRGTRWQSTDGRVTLDTTSSPPGGTDLDALFERATAVTPERKVTYKVRKPDFLVVTGETPTGRFYIRHAAGADGIRGFTMSYDKTLTAEVDRLVIAVANSFSPFPNAAPAPEATPSATLSPGGARPGAGAPAPFAPPPLPGSVARPVATGLALGNGRVLTAAAALETCPSPLIGGAPARLTLRDPTGALALLEGGQHAQGAQPPAIRVEAPASGEALVVLGAEAKGAAVAPGTAGAGSVFAPLQPGAGGAPVLDRSGRLVGLVARFPATPRLIAGVMPPTSHALVPAGTIAAFLAQAGVAPGELAPAHPQGASLGAAAAPVLGSVVAISCGR